MFIRIVINDLIKGSISSNKIFNLLSKVFLYVIMFCGVYNLSKALISFMELNKFINLILCFSVISIYFINLIIHKIILQEIKQDSIIIFLKKERFQYIKGRVDLFLIKSLIYFVIPSIIPIFMTIGNTISIILFVLIIGIYYFLNIILIFGINYIKFKSENYIYTKIIYFFVSIILLIAFIFITSYTVMLILSAIVKENIIMVINLKTNFSTVSILMLVLDIVLLMLYLFICNFMNRKIYIFFYDVEIENKRENELGNKLITSRYLKNKILLKDIIGFYRKKSMLKIIGFIVQVLILSFLCYIYLEDQTDINNFIDSIPIINLVILLQIIPIVFIHILINYQELKIKEELLALKQFSIKVNIKDIVVEKSNYLFLVSIAPILLGMLIIFCTNIGIRFLIESVYVIVPMIFFGKFLSLFIIKFILVKEKIKEFKLIFLVIIIISNVALLICSMNPNNTNIIKNIYNLLFVIVNIILYYIEVLGLIIFRKWWKNVGN